MTLDVDSLRQFHFVNWQMEVRQEGPLVDLSGLGSQLKDLDRKLVKDLELAVPEKPTMRR